MKVKYQPWTLEEALLLIRDLQPVIREANYHICLGGGVLNTGQSKKDLDLFIFPLNGYESDAWKIVEILGKELEVYLGSIRDSPDYHKGPESPDHFKEFRWFEYLGKRVEVFIG